MTASLKEIGMARVLVVEDNPSNQKLVVFLLEKEGFEVRHAGEALEGIRIAREWQPQLILMDVQMPGMDGLTATRLLKDAQETAAIKIVALTALAMPGDRERAKAAGCDDYITKPIHYQEFLETVKRVLGSSEVMSSVSS
jgi:CheY-like chemotaxis protein